MTRRLVILVALVVALPGCTTTRRTPNAGPSTTSVVASSDVTRSTEPLASTPPGRPTVGPQPQPPPPPAQLLPSSFGAGPVWPRAARGPAPAAYGAVVTQQVAVVEGGGTLAAGLLLPRLDANARTPLVMTPCGRRVRLRANYGRTVAPGSGGPLPKPAGRIVIVVDPGHGGPAHGAIGVDGSKESDRVLSLGREVARRADVRLARVYLTRDRDFDASLEFRVALADALRADVAISVHLNAAADGPLDRPGLETYASVQDTQGRRLAGVMYEAQRRFLQRYPGPWIGDRDAGAKYRLGRRGGDYYGLLRRAHLPWVISESMFMTSAHDLRLLDSPAFESALAASIADAAATFATSRAPGSGWVTPYPRVPNPTPAPGSEPPCVDPAR